MNLKKVRASPWVLAACVILSGCNPEEPHQPAPSDGASAAEQRPRPNIVLITLCTFRYSHMGAAGYPRNTTPFLDSLAERGLFFENAMSTSSWTKPAAASILTGLSPNVHGMTDYLKDSEVLSGEVTPKRILAEEIVTVAECLREAGYATSARINNVHVSEFFNMTQGFDDYDSDHRMDTARMVEEFGRWVGGLDDRTPFFFFLLSRDAHVTYDPRYEYYVRFNRVEPEVSGRQYARYPWLIRRRAKRVVKNKGAPVDPELRRRYVDLYDAELAQLDDALSRIPATLEQAGRASNTVVIVTADHGERFFEHGLLGHGQGLDDATLHVPLIVAAPWVDSGRRIKRLVSVIDIYATIAALAGAEAPTVLQGQNLLAAVGDQPADHKTASAFASFYEQEHMVRSGDYTYYLRKDGDKELFNLAVDPGEVRNIAEEEVQTAERLNGYLLGWLEREERLRALVARGQTRTLSPEVIEQLRSLGYIE